MTPPANRHSWRWHAGAFLLYATVSIVFIDHGASLTHEILGFGGDTQSFIWFLQWWPWALTHHVDLFHTDLVWQPLGAPVLWLTSIPLLSLLTAPLTLLCGPGFSYNLLILAAPVLSASAAYFLCHYLTKSFPAALIGGYLFGFSSYETAANFATINLSFTFFLPCLVLLALLRMDGKIGRLPCVLLASLMMICQFFISIEIFATIILFGFIAWLLALRTLPERRAALRMLWLDAAIAGLVTLFVLVPFFRLMIAHAHYVSLPPKWPYIFTADLLNFIVPTQLTKIGGHFGAPLSRHFMGDLQEQDAYLGLPLIMILLLFARQYRRTPGGAFLLVTLAIFLIASLGPRLWVGGMFSSIVLPWFVFLKLPLISAALPARFALYVSLVVALIVALWIAQALDNRSRNLRLLLGGLACITLIPAPHPAMKTPRSIFFEPGRVEAALGPSPRLLVLPFGPRGASTYWQAENKFGYLQTGGYLGYPPAAMQHFAAVEQLFDNFELPGFLDDFREFCVATKTQYVVAGPGTPPALWVALARLGWRARKIDDVTVFTVPLANTDKAGNG